MPLEQKRTLGLEIKYLELANTYTNLLSRIFRYAGYFNVMHYSLKEYAQEIIFF